MVLGKTDTVLLPVLSTARSSVPDSGAFTCPGWPPARCVTGGSPYPRGKPDRYASATTIPQTWAWLAQK